MSIKSLGFLFLLLVAVAPAACQSADSIKWLTFEQLEDSLNRNPKRVFVDFYTDWCTYCRKMDNVVFTKPEVIATLNKDYYAVRFNAETDRSISFGGKLFVNDQVELSRNPVHQIAQLLALRNGAFNPPVLVLLDEQFNIKSIYFEYMDSKSLIKALN